MNNERQDRNDTHSSLVSATILGWLIDQGCELSEEALSALPGLRAANPRWHPDLDKKADEDIGEVTGGFVEPATDPSVLLGVPLSQVIHLAEINSTYSEDLSTEYRPFDGLVQQYPGRAVATLTLVAKSGEHPGKFWKSLLREWPDKASTRLTCLLSARLARLPANFVILLRYDVFSWLTHNTPKLTSPGQNHALSVLDALLDKLFTGGTDITNSVILNERVAGDDRGWSRRTMGHAINGPVGKAVEFLLAVLKSQDLVQGSGISPELKSRFERLATAPGEGSEHAVCLLAHHVELLHFLDPDWTSDTVVPWFDLNHPYAEPAWNGFCFAKRMPEPELFSLLKPHFLNVFSLAPTWKWNDEGFRVLHNRLVIGCLWREHHEVYLSVDEARATLRTTNHNGRSHCISFLTDLIEQGEVSWDRFGKMFLNEAWPKESRFQSETTTLNFILLASVTGDNFPDAVDTIAPRLVHVYGNSWFLYRILSGADRKNPNLVDRFPREVLTLINKTVPDNPPGIPFDLNPTLEKIAESEPNVRQNQQWQRLKRIARNE